MCVNNNNNNNLLHLHRTFLGTQSTLRRRGESPQPQPVCSIQLDDAMAAILHQNAHHTPANWWRGDRLMKPISVWGLLGGHDGQMPMGKFGQDDGFTPLLFFEEHPGIFNDHRESGPRFNVSSEGCCFLQYSVPSLHWGVRTHTDHRVSTPCWPHFQQQPSFPSRSPIQVLSRLNPAHL